MRNCIIVPVLCCSVFGTAFAQTETKLTASDAASDDWFGYSVSVSLDSAVVGTHNESAYVYGPPPIFADGFETADSSTWSTVYQPGGAGTKEGH